MEEIDDFFNHKTPRYRFYYGEDTAAEPEPPPIQEDPVPMQLDPEEDDTSDEEPNDYCQQPDMDFSDEKELFIYDKYPFRPNGSKSYPIDVLKTQILERIESNPVTIIEGPTGCGKTTQIPQWILNDHREKRKYCNIVVTQPRRIATMSAAKRICEEQQTRLGEFIGYRIALDSKTSPDTRLEFVTTGILVRQIIRFKSLNRFTHIILDEVHEREKDMDFLLIIVKKLLRKNSPNVKIILMSATFNVEKFSDYFRMKGFFENKNAPIVSLTDVKSYPVGVHYLEELTVLGETIELNADDPKVTKNHYRLTLKLLNAFEKIDEVEERNSAHKKPCVLIFLPGLQQIEELHKILSTEDIQRRIDMHAPLHKWWLVPLHSSITVEEQNKTFRNPPEDVRKVILATNIAESSITVPDVKYVIDYCMNKMLFCNPRTNFSSLQLCWTSKANCNQRKGRAGRVRSGKVYRLITKHFYEDLLDESLPEMMRSSLEDLVLSSKMLNMGAPRKILSRAIDPPNLANFQKTILTLKEIGALYKTVAKVYMEDDGDLTYLGKIMSSFPLDVRVSKLIALGHIFGCLRETIIIGAALSTPNIFCMPFNQKLRVFNLKLAWSHGSMSDCLVYLNVYNVYEINKRNFSSYSDANNWCRENYIQLNALKHWEHLINEITARSTVNFKISNNRARIWKENELPVILKIIIAGAFYPHYFTLNSFDESHEKETAKLLNGKDPHNTVYFTGMDNNHPGPLYSKQIKDYFRECSTNNMEVEFDPNSQKVFVTFEKNTTNPGNQVLERTMIPVYQSVKMRKLNIPLTLHVMPLQKGIEMAYTLGICKPINTFSESVTTSRIKNIVYRLPNLEKDYIDLTVTHIVNCGHFWAQSNDENTHRDRDWIDHMLNNDQLIPLKTRPGVGNIYAAPFKLRGLSERYYRARVNCVNRNSVEILFIDYGRCVEIHADKLRMFGNQMGQLINTQPLAFECTLARIGPSSLELSFGTWSQKANNYFSNAISGEKLVGKVFSVSNSIVSLDLICDDVNINDLLITNGYAQSSEETYASKMNRNLRDRINTMSPIEIEAENKMQSFNNIKKKACPVYAPLNECTESISLRGPFSPFEVSLSNILQSNTPKAVKIDPNSVNSILLDSTFCWNERFIVGAVVHESMDQSSFILHHTTAMPHIPGFLPVITLMFCPVAELHPDRTGYHYKGALCGLGHIAGKSLFPEHDIGINMKVRFDNDDLKRINYFRMVIDYTFNQPIQNPVCDTILESDKSCLQNIRDSLTYLLEKRRFIVDDSFHEEWKENNSGDLQCSDFSCVYAKHKVTNLKKIQPSYKTMLLQENRKIHDICKSSIENSTEEFECKLCGVHALTLNDLRLHIYSQLHRENEMRLASF